MCLAAVGLAGLVVVHVGVAAAADAGFDVGFEFHDSDSLFGVFRAGLFAAASSPHSARDFGGFDQEAETNSVSVWGTAWGPSLSVGGTVAGATGTGRAAAISCGYWPSRHSGNVVGRYLCSSLLRGAKWMAWAV